MDKRFFLALLLTAIVIIVPPVFLNRSARRASPVADSVTPSSRLDTTSAVDTPRRAAVPPVGVMPSPQAEALKPAAPIETTTVRTRLSRYAFSSEGATPISIVLDSYPSRRPSNVDPKAARAGTHEPSELLAPHSALARYRLALGPDTISLDTVPLRAELKQGATGPRVSYTGSVAGRPLTLDYAVVPDSFLLHVTASVTDAPAGSALLIGLPRTLRSNEPDTLDDIGHLAVSYRLGSGDIESVGFSKLDSTETRAESRPTQWIATRNKYFLVAYRAPTQTPFSAVQLRGGHRINKTANDVIAGAVLPHSKKKRDRNQKNRK